MKGSIRTSILQQRDAMAPAEVTKRSALIHQQLQSSDVLRDAKTIFTYVSFQNEVDTIALIAQWVQQRMVYIPYIADKHNHIMHPSRLHSLSHLDTSEFGIQSTTELDPAPLDTMDAVIVPGIAFDERGHRIGFGRGYYDRLLKDYRGTTIALAFSFQIIDRIPEKEHDVAINYIVTEKEILTCT